MVLEAVRVDFDTPSKRRHRRRGDIQRHWDTRYKRFLKAGFLHKEAVWAADEGLSARYRQVRQVLRHRKNLIAFYMKYGDSEEEARLKAAKDLETKLEDLGEEGLNLFYEVSP